MLYLLHQQIFWLLLTALAAGVAGWAWHKWRYSARSDALDEQRDALRRELVGLVNGTADDGAGELAREIDTLRARASLRDAKVAELEQRLEDARTGREELVARLAEFERGAVEVAPVVAAVAEPDSSHWRTRYLEARVRHLESLPQDETAALTLQSDLDAALARNGELENALEAASSATPNGDEINRLRWHTRYLESRVRYLERPEPVAAASDDDEEKRAYWRKRFLTARVAHLEDQLARTDEEAKSVSARLALADDALAGAQSALAARNARIAELEPLEPAAAEAQRLAWRARYLDARVRHLESLSAASVAAAPQAPARDDQEPAPLVPAGAEERPPALPAARFGAPDDLTLIDGVTPMQQSTLHALGVFHFDQLGDWTPANVAWVDQYLRLRGRIVEERWVAQAASLARGEQPPARAREDA